METLMGRNREWEAEYDRRKAAGAKTRKMSRGEVQIADDAGNWYRRNGKGCCGCGRHAQADRDDISMHEPPKWKRKR